MSRKNHNSGFSLMELVIVILVIGILAVIAIPNLNVTTLSVSAAADLMAAEIRNLQSNAIFEGESKTISSGSGTFYTVDGVVRELPGEVETEAFSITFNALGEPDTGAASFALGRDGITNTILVTELTGKVTIQR